MNEKSKRVVFRVLVLALAIGGVDKLDSMQMSPIEDSKFARP